MLDCYSAYLDRFIYMVMEIRLYCCIHIHTHTYDYTKVEPKRISMLNFNEWLSLKVKRKQSKEIKSHFQRLTHNLSTSYTITIYYDFGYVVVNEHVCCC